MSTGLIADTLVYRVSCPSKSDGVTEFSRDSAPFTVMVEGEVRNSQGLYVYLVVDDSNGKWIQPGLGYNYSGVFKEKCFLGEEKARDSFNKNYRVFAVVTSEEHLPAEQLKRETIRAQSRVIKLHRTRT